MSASAIAESVTVVGTATAAEEIETAAAEGATGKKNIGDCICYIFQLFPFCYLGFFYIQNIVLKYGIAIIQ